MLCPSKQNVKALGRIREKDGVLYLGNAGSYIEFEITASYLTARLDTRYGREGSRYPTWLTVSLDGTERVICLKEGVEDYPLFGGESSRRVTVGLLKRSESGYGNVGILGFLTDAKEITPTEKKKRRIEFVGDSITCGFGCEQKDGEAFSTSGENCAAAYAIRTAQLLDADWHLVAQSGIGVYSSCVTEETQQPNTQLLMPELYRYTDLSCDQLRGWEPQLWEGKQWQPQVVVINLGTNDALFARDHQERQGCFGRAYESFLRQVARANPQARLVCILGVMDQRLCRQVRERVEKLEKEGLPVSFLQQKPQQQSDGIGAAGHPNVVTQEKSARELVAFLENQTGWAEVSKYS